MDASIPLVLLLIRHGQSTANQAGTFQGWLDSQLSLQGREQGKRLSQHLASFPIKAIYTSPLKRAHNTANLINEPHQLPIKVDPGLMELNVGELAGKLYKVAQAQFPELLHMFKTNPAFVRFPSGETLSELQTRALAVIERIRSTQTNEGMVAVISHNVCIRALTIGLLGWHWESLWQLAMDPASYSLLSVDANHPVIMVSWNQTSHLGTLPKFRPSGLLGL